MGERGDQPSFDDSGSSSAGFGLWMGGVDGETSQKIKRDRWQNRRNVRTLQSIEAGI